MRTKNSNIQILRAIFFLLIVLYHLSVPGFFWGWCGIEGFFCISGFFLFAKLYSKDNTISQGLSLFTNRVKRLLVPWYLILVVVFFFYIILIGNVNTNNIISLLMFATGLQNINWAFGHLDTYKNLAHLWTISIEIQCALILVLLACLLNTKKNTPENENKIQNLPYLAIIISILFVVLCPFFTDNSAYISLNPLSHLAAFGLGGLLHNIKESPNCNKISISLSASGFVGFVILLLLCMSKGTTTPIAQGFGSATLSLELTPCIYLAYIFLAMIFCGILGLLVKHPSEKKSPLSLIGDHSYVLYLLHYPIIMLLVH